MVSSMLASGLEVTSQGLLDSTSRLVPFGLHSRGELLSFYSEGIKWEDHHDKMKLLPSPLYDFPGTKTDIE